MGFYRVLISGLAPFLALLFVWRYLRGREDAEALGERLLGPRGFDGPQLWLHGASNGELASARLLIEALQEARPDLGIWVTANTVTGRDMVAGWGMARVRATLAPIDLRWLGQRVLRRAEVIGYIGLENELWPNRIVSCHEAGVPVMMIGARMSEKSAAKWALRAGLAQAVFARMVLVSAQSEAADVRFRGLGIAKQAFAPVVDLKALYRAKKQGIPVEFQGFKRSETVLFAATHEGEDATLIAAFVRAKAEREELRLILAPRHARRGDEIVRLVEAAGLDVARRSVGDAPECAVYLADTMGEMALWYQLAGVSFIGGSLVEVGGHTPFEPSAYGTVMLHGPYVANFAETYGALDAAGGAIAVRGVEEISTAILAHLDGSDAPEAATACLAGRGDLDVLLAGILARL